MVTHNEDEVSNTHVARKSFLASKSLIIVYLDAKLRKMPKLDGEGVDEMHAHVQYRFSDI
jgi:hypothetical protein